MADSVSRDPSLVENVLQLTSDFYRAPTFCVLYKKGQTNCQEFFSLSDKEKCYARIRELRCKPGVRYLQAEFYFDLEVDKI